MTTEGFISSDEAIVFEPFRLFPARQLLLEADKPVQLGSRAFELLTALVRRAGDVVHKDDLIAEIWPGVFVDEGNLRVHIAALRRALGDGHAGRRFIITVQGKGYSFVAPLVRSRAETIATQQDGELAPDRFPVPLRKIIGRSSVCDALIAEIPQRRFVTIVGSGGIGKTTVALAVATALSSTYRDGVRFVDLAPIVTSGLVSSALAAAIAVPVGTDSPLPAILGALCKQEMLIVLDSCEHVLDAVASLSEAIFKGAPRVHIVATSREALRVEGERIHRLEPLEVPINSEGLGAAEALTYPAIQLFVERAVDSLYDFALTDAESPVVADICRRLDGVPLSIELVASRVDAFGVRGLATLLDNQLQLLRHGHRRSLPRHETLSAALDWSYDLLAEPERVVLRRLTVLSGTFTFQSASAIVAGDGIDHPIVAECIANLVSASLIVVDIAREIPSYRLLDSTRVYARKKLIESGEYDRVARRHAVHFLNFLRKSELESLAGGVVSRQESGIDNLRGALDWAFSPSGDAALAIDLTAEGVSTWMSLSLVEECRVRVEQALSANASKAHNDPRSLMQLHAALGGMLLYTTGPAPEVVAAFTTALKIAEEIGNTEYRLRALWGLWTGRQDISSKLTIAEQFMEVASASGNQVDRALADRAVGSSHNLLGDQIKAHQYLQRMIDRPIGNARKSLIVRYQYDPLITGHMRYAWVLWQLGYPERAKRNIDASLREIYSMDHSVSVCLAMSLGPYPVALACGDLDAAGRYSAYMIDHASKHALIIWEAWGRCMRGVILIKQGEAAAGLNLLWPTLAQLSERNCPPLYVQADVATAMAITGKVAEALASVNESLADAEFRHEGWQLAELLRVKGEILLQQTTADVVAAENCFRQSLDLARRQQARSWELRTATSLARLCIKERRFAEARSALEAAYSQFTEGFDTADLVAARGLLAEVRLSTERTAGAEYVRAIL